MNSAVKKVALTFDDGPNGEHTLAILEILKSHNLKAAFFFPAKNVERLPEIALMAKNQGHIIGNHTYDHPHLNTLTADQIRLQIEKAERVFAKVLDLQPRYFRPPYGEYNKTVEAIIKEKGYRLVLWDMACYSMDWQNPSSDVIAEISTDRARNGSIILLHDGRNIMENQPRDNTVEALRLIIPRLLKKGFEITTLDNICSDWKNQ
jgi:peptidoglycan-N-acetylglucosamine deacetylase